jgi:hypothetical protein
VALVVPMTFLDGADMQVQEELAALLSRNLTLNQVPVQEQPKITYSVSQHYHHSAHVARQPNLEAPQPPQQRPASEPPQPEYQATASVLSQHGVDPSVLSRAQLELFKTVDDEQKMYLLQLWRYSPPTNSNDNPTLAWSSTTVEQEEQLVRLRKEAEALATSTMSLDGTPVPTPMQGGDSRWPVTAAQSYMEPYMSAGYAERPLETGSGGYFGNNGRAGGPHYTPATDPVYRAQNVGVVDWQPQRNEKEKMENDYGLLMAMRENMEL